jgi:hypothetical protein
MPKQQTNAPGLTNVSFKGHDWQDRAMRRLPKDVRHFVLYDVIADISLISILRHVKKVGAAQALADMKAKQAQLARLAYGDDYPSQITTL